MSTTALVVPKSCEFCAAQGYELHSHTKAGRKVELDPAKPLSKARRSRFNAFISAYRVTGAFGAACSAVKVSPATIREWMKVYPELQEHFDTAQQEYLGILEEELHQRAVVGYSEPIVNMGKVVTYAIKKSDKLLELALRANAPKKYAPFNQRTIGAEMGVDKEGNKYFKVYEGFDPKDV